MTNYLEAAGRNSRPKLKRSDQNLLNIINYMNVLQKRPSPYVYKVKHCPWQLTLDCPQRPRQLPLLVNWSTDENTQRKNYQNLRHEFNIEFLTETFKIVKDVLSAVCPY